MTKDAIYGMKIDETSAAVKNVFKGRTFYFCAPGCKKAFDKDPRRYLGDAERQNHHGLVRDNNQQN